ncbi:hypothetical protein OS493_036826 [Desmophyllum pertusum]|uniref:G-protein coupled receptors family 3 profile domain-containing protein n=1 Tax=Desmophyllum pertusum TaxID=174260 RepID=A0A9W9ZX49_9CNID|nr:hypothetical protein OS493_036826 [Desmophyllum pertusum]
MICLLVVRACILLSHFISANFSHVTSTDTPGVKAGDVTLGGLFFLHYKGINNEECGDFNAPGLGHAQAMIYAIEKVNNDSYLLPNVTLGYNIHDYCESASLAIKSTYQFVKDTDSHFACAQDSLLSQAENKTAKHHSSPIVSLIGPADSGSSVLVGSLLKVAGIPAVSFAATSEELSSPFYKHFYRTVPSDKQQASAMADVFEYFDWSYVATIAVDDSYGRYGVWALERNRSPENRFALLSLNIFHIEIIVSKLKRHPNVKVVVLWLFGGYGRAFIKELEKQNLLDRTWVLSDALAAEQPATHIQSLFRVLDGALGIQPLYYRNKDFESYLTTFTPQDMIGKHISHWWNEVWIAEFNCSIIDTNAFSVCGENVTLSANVIHKLYDAFLPYVIEAVYAVAHALHMMYACTEPHGLLPGGRCPDTHPSVRPLDVGLYLRNVSFEGLMGKVQFDESGDPLTSSYSVINFQRRHENGLIQDFKEIVGSWNATSEVRLHIELDKIKWSGKSSNSSIPTSACSLICPPGTAQSVTTSCCWECSKCPLGSVNPYPGSLNCSECPEGQRSNEQRTECEHLPIVNIKLTDITGYIITGFTSFGVLLTIFSCLVLVKYRETPLVKASSRELSAILLISIAMFFAQTFLSLTRPTTLVCRLAYCFNYTALGTCVATLMIKTLRILSAFHANRINKRTKQCIMTTKIQATLVFLLNSVVFCLLTFWLLLDAPYMTRVIQRGEYIFLTCRPHRATLGFSLHIAINGYLVLLSLICTFHAFKARKLPENFNEARYIGFAMYILLLSTIAYFPVDFAGLENQSVTIVTCATTLVSSYGLLGCMFAPKVYVILLHPEQNTTAAVRNQVSDYTFRQHSLPSSLTRAKTETSPSVQ